MGKHQILQNCSLSLRLNFIFEIGQQLCHKCCFFCSNSVIKSLFLRLDQPVCMTVSIATGTSNGSCSDALTLPISDWLFHSEGGASCDWAAILSVAFFPIQNYTSDMSWVFYSLCWNWTSTVNDDVEREHKDASSLKNAYWETAKVLWKRSMWSSFFCFIEKKSYVSGMCRSEEILPILFLILFSLYISPVLPLHDKFCLWNTNS